MAERGLQKALELGGGEFPRRHRKIGMLDGPPSRDVTLNGHVVGRVGEHHVRLVGPQEARVARLLQSIGAEQAVLAQEP